MEDWVDDIWFLCWSACTSNDDLLDYFLRLLFPQTFSGTVTLASQHASPTRQLLPLALCHVAPQAKSPSRFASSPGADASQTPTFVGQRHKCVPLDTYHPTSRTSRATPFSEPHVAGLALTLAVYRRIGATSVRSLSCFCFRLLPSTQRTCRVYIPPRPAFGQASK